MITHTHPKRTAEALEGGGQLGHATPPAADRALVVVYAGPWHPAEVDQAGPMAQQEVVGLVLRRRC